MGLFSKGEKKGGHAAKSPLLKRLFSSPEKSSKLETAVIPEPVRVAPLQQLAPLPPSPPPPPPSPPPLPPYEDEEEELLEEPELEPEPEPEPAPVSPVSTKAPRLPKRKAHHPLHIQVDARPKVDTTRLRLALLDLQGVMDGEALAESMSFSSDALVAQFTALVAETARLQGEADGVLAHRGAAAALSDFFVSVVNVVGSNGERLKGEHASVLRRVKGGMKEAYPVFEAWSQPGWLLRMAKGEGMVEELSRLHSGTQSLLHSVRLDASSACGALPDAHYPDQGMALRRLLKAIGEGSVEAAVRQLRLDSGARVRVSELTGAPMEEVEAEAALEPLSFAGGAEAVPNGPSRDAECLAVFNEHLTTSRDAITADGFETLMAHMGLLDGVDLFERPAAARAALVAADSDYDGALDYEDFRKFYGRHPISAVRLHLRTQEGMAAEHRLREAFLGFTTFGGAKPLRSPARGPASPSHSAGRSSFVDEGPGLDCMRFAKLCRDCGLLSWGMTAPHVDVVYAAAKPRSARRLDFDHFLVALVLVADRRAQSMLQVSRMVAEAGGPALRGTRTGYVKLHDDPAKLSGISARGGPSFDTLSPDLRALVDRSRERAPPPLSPPSGAAGVRKTQPTQPSSPRLSTKWRVTSSTGPTTPGRGVSYSAAEARKAAAAAKTARYAFGRTVYGPAPASPPGSRGIKAAKAEEGLSPKAKQAAVAAAKEKLPAARQLELEAAAPEPVEVAAAAPPPPPPRRSHRPWEEKEVEEGPAVEEEPAFAVAEQPAAAAAAAPLEAQSSFSMDTFFSARSVPMVSLSSLVLQHQQQEEEKEAIEEQPAEAEEAAALARRITAAAFSAAMVDETPSPAAADAVASSPFSSEEQAAELEAGVSVDTQEEVAQLVTELSISSSPAEDLMVVVTEVEASEDDEDGASEDIFMESPDAVTPSAASEDVVDVEDDADSVECDDDDEEEQAQHADEASHAVPPAVVAA